MNPATRPSSIQTNSDILPRAKKTRAAQDSYQKISDSRQRLPLLSWRRSLPVGCRGKKFVSITKKGAIRFRIAPSLFEAGLILEVQPQSELHEAREIAL